MDYPIEPITAIEERGRSARRLGLPPEACPYAFQSAHWCKWQLGYLTDALEAANAPVLLAANEVAA
jgi:hypothetical protein